MNTPPTPLPTSIDSLLLHADWVRALARHLVRDPATADDVEQEVWREAIERPPTHASNMRGWLSSVTRNVVRSARRGDARRTHRERSVARDERSPSTAQLVEEASLSRELADVVLKLDEPYRTTLLLRYFREMSIDDIATAQELSRETVRTRQRRGLEMMRERLDATRGGRDEWIAALAPLARVESASVAVGGSMFVLALWLTAAALVASVIVWKWTHPTESREVAALPSVATSDSRTLESAESSTRSESSRAPLANESDARNSSAVVASGTELRSVHGRVIDLTGHPMPRATVVFLPRFRPTLQDGVLTISHPSPSNTIGGSWSTETISPRELAMCREDAYVLDEFVRQRGSVKGLREVMLGQPLGVRSGPTDSRGTFTASLPEDTWDVELDDPHTLIVAEFGALGSENWVLVAAPAVRLAGTVVDVEGAPIAGASLSSLVSLESLRDFDFDFGAGSAPVHSFSTRTGARGDFDIRRVPRVPGHALMVQSTGYEGALIEVPEIDTSHLDVVLKREKEVEHATLRGVVLDSSGALVSGALVQLGQDRSESGKDGHFELRLSCCHENAPLTAVKKGFQAAIVPEFGQATMTSQDDLVLRLGPPALTLRGRVTGPMGKPIARANVRLLGATASGSSSNFLEDIAAGNLPSEPQTSSDGRFEFGGLLDKTYRIAAWWNEDFVVLTDPIQAGTDDLVIKFEASQYREVHGRLVSRRGEGLADASVALSLKTWGTVGFSGSLLFGRVSTDEDGRFVLHNVPSACMRVSVSGAGIREDSFPIADGSTEELLLTAKLQTRVLLDVADGGIDAVGFLDSRGGKSSVTVKLVGTTTVEYSVERIRGEFPPFNMTDDVAEIVLFSKGREVRRAPIDVRRASTLRLQL